MAYSLKFQQLADAAPAASSHLSASRVLGSRDRLHASTMSLSTALANSGVACAARRRHVASPSLKRYRGVPHPLNALTWSRSPVPRVHGHP